MFTMTLFLRFCCLLFTFRTPAKLLRALKFEGLMALVAYGATQESQESDTSAASTQSCAEKMVYEVEFYKACMSPRICKMNHDI